MCPCVQAFYDSSATDAQGAVAEQLPPMWVSRGPAVGTGAVRRLTDDLENG